MMVWAEKASSILMAAGLVAGCAGAGHQLPAFSEQDSARAAQEIVAAPDLTPTTRTAFENEQIARSVLRKLQTAARPVCAATGRGRCWYTLEFSPKGQMSAYVVKNQIVMFNGLTQYLEMEDEFALVLAHEMGHDISGHYEKSAQNRAVGGVIAGLIFAGVAGATNAYPNSPYQARYDMQTAMSIGEMIGDISFSKEHEREADYIAAYVMARAGYNPDSAGDVWIKLAKASGKMKTQLFDTHPAGPDRLAAWEQAVDEVRYSKDLMPNLTAAKEEPLLQQARIFNDPIEDPSLTETNVALASRSYSSPTGGAATSARALGAAARPLSTSSTGQTQDGTWAGRGQQDSCGADWGMELRKNGSLLRGNMWWNGVRYDVYGKVDATGRTRSAHAGKSKESRNMPAPRFFKLEIAFEAGTARGHYAIDSQGAACRAHFLLSRTYQGHANVSTDPNKNLGGSKTPAGPPASWVWRTVTDKVFAYAEFGGKGRSLNIPTSVDLELTFQQADWGIFDYDARDGRRGRGWISLQHVERKF